MNALSIYSYQGIRIEGTLNIVNPGNLGIYSEGRIAVTTSGILNISDTSATAQSAIHLNYPTPLVNEGTVYIDGFGHETSSNPYATIYLDSGADLKNLSTGNMIITNNGHIGVLVADGNSSITNNGSLEISNSVNKAISNPTGPVTNNGSLTIRDCAKGAISHSLINELNSTVTIQNCEYGIRKGLINSGTITIDSTIAEGIRGELTNENTGIINLSNCGTMGFFENITTSTHSNKGIINIMDSGSHGINFKGVFENEGSIFIGNSNISGMVNQGSFINHTHGTMNITGSAANGIQITTDNVTENYGLITIEATTNHSIVNSGIFNNHKFGELDITNSGKFGLVNFLGKIFNNRGLITIDTTGNDGLFNVGRFDNKASGEINVREAGDFGLFNGREDRFFNSGLINVINPANHGMLNKGTVTNRNSGIFNFINPGGLGFYNIEANDKLINLGKFHISGSTSNAVLNNGTITNSGTFSGNGNFKFNSNPLQGTISPSDDFEKMFFLGSQTFDSVSIHAIDIGGVTPEMEHDLISVATVAIIAGTLQIQFDSLYFPSSGDRIVFLTANSISGTYSSIIPALPTGWSIDYSVNGEVALVYAPAPFSYKATQRKSYPNATAWTIFPNPIQSGGQLYLSNKGNESAMKIKILNSNGRVIKTYNQSNQSFIKLPNLEVGLYFIEFAMKDGFEKQQIVIID